MKVENFYNKNQFIIYGKNEVVFQSYDSKICSVKKNGVVSVYPHWDYSNTTRKHFYAFLREYTDFRVNSKKDMLKLIKEGKVLMKKYK